jgi:hypothetical protein
MRSVYLIILIFAFSAFNCLSQEKGIKYKLIAIDSAEIREYYVFHFLNISSNENIICLSLIKSEQESGCWEKLMVNNVYNINFLEKNYISFNGIYCMLKGMRFTKGDKVIFESGQIYYGSYDVNGSCVRIAK